MNVRELIEVLALADQNSEVILQKDAEGNGYSPLYVCDDSAVYVPTSTWNGDVYSLEWSANEADMGEAEWDLVKSKPRCVVLAPVN